MSMIGFPLLLIPIALYNIVVFLMPGVAFTAPVASLPLTSGARWDVTFGDSLVTLAALLLLVEFVKAAKPGAKYITDHLLSLVVFGIAVAEFVVLAPFATSAFFFLTVLAAVEFLAGVMVAWRMRSLRRAMVTASSVPEQIEVNAVSPNEAANQGETGRVDKTAALAASIAAAPPPSITNIVSGSRKPSSASEEASQVVEHPAR